MRIWRSLVIACLKEKRFIFLALSLPTEMWANGWLKRIENRVTVDLSSYHILLFVPYIAMIFAASLTQAFQSAEKGEANGNFFIWERE